MSNINQEELVNTLGNLSVMEIIALTRKLETAWNVKAVPQAVTVPQETKKEEVVEQTEFTVVLASVPSDKKMAVIKVVRDIVTLGLKESKELVEAAPKPIKEGVSKADADEIARKLTEAGAVVEVK